MPDEQPAWVLALDGQGGGQVVPAREAARWRQAGRPLCVRLAPDVSPEASRRWMMAEAGLTRADCDAVLGEVRRSWVAPAASDVAALIGAMESLPGDRVAGGVRWALARDLLILVADPGLPVLAEAEEALRDGRGARTLAALFATLMGSSGQRALLEALEVDRQVAELEVRATTPRGPLPLDGLRGAQRDATLLRRRLTRHREIIRRLRAIAPDWLMELPGRDWESHARNADEMIDLVDGAIERLHNADGYVQNRLSALLNDRLYALTLVSWVVLPLSFVTGLLGVNVGGIPLNGRPWGFAVLCLVLAGIGVLQYAIVRRLHWLPRQNRGPGA